MADNVDITPGTGATVATDDAGAGGHVQLMKLAIATNGSATLVPADATNGILVDVSRVQGSVTVAEPVTVDGTVAVTEPVSVDDNAGSLTVDAPIATPVGTRLSDGTTAIGSTAQRLHVEIAGGSLPAGTNNIGDVDVLTLPALATGTNTIGGTIPKPATSGGLSMFTSLDLDETEEAVKGSAGQLYGWYIYNDGASEVYVKLYNATTGTVVVGTTVADMTLGIPAGSAANVFNDHGIAFSTAITAAATTGAATADVGAPAANQVVCNFLYS
jgi:hypothetical protein